VKEFAAQPLGEVGFAQQNAEGLSYYHFEIFVNRQYT